MSVLLICNGEEPPDDNDDEFQENEVDVEKNPEVVTSKEDESEQEEIISRLSYVLGKGGNIKWQKHEHPNNIRTREENIVRYPSPIKYSYFKRKNHSFGLLVDFVEVLI